MTRPVTLVAVQDSSVAFDLPSSLTKLKQLTAKAANEARRDSKANTNIVIVFPEAFLSCYPRGYAFGAKIGSRTPEGRTWFQKYHASSVPVCNLEGEHMMAIRAAASDNNVTLVVGVIERCDEPSTGAERSSYGSAHAGGYATLYCTALTISSQGDLLAAHRKLMPTGTERLVWGQGDGAGIRVADTPCGKVGAAICWENYMPMMRMALYAKGVEVYAAPTADTRETWQPTMQHIAQEGRCFVISACQFNVRSDFPEEYPGFDADLKGDEIVTRGGSVIVGPLGTVLAGPLWDQSGILVAHVDLDSLVEAKMDFDPCGHYSRPDVFTLTIDEGSKQAAVFN